MSVQRKVTEVDVTAVTTNGSTLPHGSVPKPTEMEGDVQTCHKDDKTNDSVGLDVEAEDTAHTLRIPLLVQPAPEAEESDGDVGNEQTVEVVALEATRLVGRKQSRCAVVKEPSTHSE